MTIEKLTKIGGSNTIEFKHSFQNEVIETAASANAKGKNL